jgi:predicted nucleic acid-binding protein
MDSSGWLEYLAGSPAAENFAQPIEATGELVVPTIILFEVFKKMLLSRDEDSALSVAAHMRQGQVIEFTEALSFQAARLSAELHMPMADSIVLATARHYGAILWTQDRDFQRLEGVRYFEKVE